MTNKIYFLPTLITPEVIEKLNYEQEYALLHPTDDNKVSAMVKKDWLERRPNCYKILLPVVTLPREEKFVNMIQRIKRALHPNKNNGTKGFNYADTQYDSPAVLYGVKEAYREILTELEDTYSSPSFQSDNKLEKTLLNKLIVIQKDKSKDLCDVGECALNHFGLL